ncbi:hypothetical protein [Microvirga puerhi]|uniref:Uncharacterized protein n=1 Tax=Microvirga puerhi TaxID=2876078 RepID=A0ABS7VLY0_9HYPH|nr:hypothetical protein [Microvirga puerhi]MBZ6076536.1 hypothetical protein [Microvirga puerhi]
MNDAVAVRITERAVTAHGTNASHKLEAVNKAPAVTGRFSIGSMANP